MSTAYELNVEYGLIDPEETEDIGTDKERSEALVGAHLPSVKPARLDIEQAVLSPYQETTPIVPTGRVRTPLIPDVRADIKPVVSEPPTRGPIFRSAEAILSPAQQLNREYGLTPTPTTKGIIPQEVAGPESLAARLNREMGLTPSTRPVGETKETQEPGVPVSTIFKDIMVPIEPPPQPPPPKPGIITEALSGIPHGILQLGEIGGGLVTLAGEVTGIEAVENVGLALHKTFQEMNKRFAPSVAGFQDIESAGDVARYLGHGFMSMLPFMVGTFGAGAAIRALVTKTLGKKIAERAAAKAAIGFSSIAASSTLAETGIIAGERIDEGLKAASLGLLWAIPAGMMDALPQWRLLGKLGWFGRTIAQKAEREGLPTARHYFLKEVGKQGFFEGVTESTQEIFEAIGAGKKPLSYDTLMQAANAFVIASFTGGVLGGAVSLLEPPRPTPTTPPVPPPQTPPGVLPVTPSAAGAPVVPTGPDVRALWEQHVFRPIQEPILGVEMKRVWRNFLDSVPVWRSIDVDQAKNQIIIQDINGGQLKLIFDKDMPPGQEFRPHEYVDPQGIVTILKPGDPLPNALQDTLLRGSVIIEAARRKVTESTETRAPKEKPPRIPKVDLTNPVFTRPGFRSVREFTDPVKTPLRTSHYILLTAANPQGKTLSAQENAIRNRKLLRDLKRAGFVALPARGHYTEKPEPSFFVPDITEEQALALAKKYDQESILAPKGLVYQDGSYHPADLTAINFNVSRTDFRTEIDFPDGTANFFIPINFDTKIEAPAKAAEQPSPEEARGAGVTAGETPPTPPAPTPVTTPTETTKTVAEDTPTDIIAITKEFEHYGPEGLDILSPQFMGVSRDSGEERRSMQEYPEFYKGPVDAKVTFAYHKGQRPEPRFLGKHKYAGAITDKVLTVGTPEHADIMRRAREIIAAGKRYPPDDATAIRLQAIILAKQEGYGAIDLGPTGMLLLKEHPVRSVKKPKEAPPVKRALPYGFIEAVIMLESDGKVSVRPITYTDVPGGVETLPGFTGKVYYSASDDVVYTPEMMMAKQRGEDIAGIPRSKVESLPAEGFYPAFQKLLPDIKTRAREQVPTFYHLSERVIKTKMTNPMPSSRILKMLQNAGVTKDELIWTGLDDLLKQPKTFTKQDILDHLHDNQLLVEEVLMGADVEGISTPEERALLWPPRYGYVPLVFPGALRYRELLICLPSVSPPFSPRFQSTHWEEPNVLGHVRFAEHIDTRGRRMLLLEEIQSDWHQEGRAKGYLHKQYVVRRGGTTIGYYTTLEEAQADLAKAPPGARIEERFAGQGVTPAPFAETWHKLLLRRMLRWAAENGYDVIAWTTGDQQRKRYDLGERIDEIRYGHLPDGTIDWEIVRGGKDITKELGIPYTLRPEEIISYVGRSITQQIAEGQGEVYTTYADPSGTEVEFRRLKGEDLIVGGEGLKHFYDTVITDSMKKLGKKWGASVQEAEFVGDGKTFKVPALEITPSMRESVLYEGQPLFRLKAQEQIEQPMSVRAVQTVVNNFQLHLPQDVLAFQVVDSVNELPRDVVERSRATRTTQAIYDSALNVIYIVANRHASQQDVLTSIRHELLGHFGFENLFGPKRMDEIVQEVLKLYGRDKLAYLYEAYNKIPGSPDGDYLVALEKIAEIAGTGENPTLWKRFVYWFRYHMTRLFGPIHFSEEDIKAYLWRSRILIQQKSFQDKIRKRNASMKLMDMNMWQNELPIGPPGARFWLREDTSPSHESAAENFTGFRGWLAARRNRDKNFGNQIFKPLGLFEAIGSLPHWISMNHPSFRPVTQVQWDRIDDKNRDRLYLLQDPGTNQGNNPYLDVGVLRDTSGVDALIVWSDRENVYLDNDADLQAQANILLRRNLTDTEVKAYRGWKEGFDRAIDYSVTKLRQLAVDFYSSAKWYQALKDVLAGTLPVEQVQLAKADMKDFKRSLETVSERLRKIDELEARLRALNFYAPHVRGRGDYVVRVKELDPEGNEVTIWAERFDSATQAERARIRLAQQYKDLRVVKTLEKQTTEFIYGGLNVHILEAFLEKSAERAVKEGKINETEADALLDAVFKSINDEIMARGFRQHYMQRQQDNIGGYQEENLRQVFYDYMSGLAGSMAKLDATRKFHDALQTIDKVNEPALYEYASRYITDMLRNPDSLDNKLNALKTLPYLWYISMNLRLAVTQMFQNAVTAYPILTRVMSDLGVKGHASVELAKAMKDLRGNLSPEEALMLQRAYIDGETMANFIQEIKGDISHSWASRYFTKFVDLVSTPFAGMERFNRKSSLLAAFRVARRAGQTEAEAYETAKEFVRSAHYAYGLANFPQLLRDGTPFSKIAGLGYVFKSFPHNYVLSMIHYTRNKEGRLALGVLMRSLAALTVLGGVGAAPFIDDLLDILERLTGYPARSVIRKSLERVGGPLLASAGMEGLFALVGIDMSGSTKIQIPIPGVGEYDPGTIMMGVYGGLIDKGKNAISFAVNNQWMRAIESVSPSGVEFAFKSYRLATEGLRTAQGKPILDERGRPVKATPYETAVGLMGFRPQRISEVQKERRVAQNIKDFYAEQRKKILKKMRTATTQEERREIFKDIQKYNLSIMKYGHIIPRISAQTLRRAMQPERGYMEYERLFEE